jgi:hypothetical protein
MRLEELAAAAAVAAAAEAAVDAPAAFILSGVNKEATNKMRSTANEAMPFECTANAAIAILYAIVGF